ncbi:39S ribosomal protein L19, mitochondrial [Daktulosphaira vitifoliae]|uniref:39S ribosomal protein L19, mitochondrial n=1 Tax=Daktulosphaira vitifoliae TaxID=58002 RepID=UPI0021AAD632|nr:39S ribosomal protein L19, mitochondrial [Daktulosphaira vitifoliae]
MYLNIYKLSKVQFSAIQLCRFSTKVISNEQHLSNDTNSEKILKPERKSVVPANSRYIYPEFLPDPKMQWRNSLREKLERMDMIQRRKHIDIPEFFVGIIMAVTSSNLHAPNKSTRFVGICIQRLGCGLRANFTLRNIVKHVGTEMKFQLYDPTVQKIEVLRLEKRLDDELLYLRDAPNEYSSYDENMEAEFLPEGSPVPINTTLVKLKPRPWRARWERKGMKGLADLELEERFYNRAEELATPWEKYDLMKQYRKTIPEEEQKEIFAEVYSELHEVEVTRKKLKRKRVFVKPNKTI